MLRQHGLNKRRCVVIELFDRKRTALGQHTVRGRSTFPTWVLTVQLSKRSREKRSPAHLQRNGYPGLERPRGPLRANQATRSRGHHTEDLESDLKLLLDERGRSRAHTLEPKQCRSGEEEPTLFIQSWFLWNAQGRLGDATHVDHLEGRRGARMDQHLLFLNCFLQNAQGWLGARGRATLFPHLECRVVARRDQHF